MGIKKNPERLNRKNLEFLERRYEFISELGTGGMGTVFRAHDSHLDIDVAIKVINSTVEKESHAIEFQKEAKTLCKLKNINLVSVLDFGAGPNNALYMVQEYTRGKTLQDILSEKGRLSVEETLPIFIQIGNGMVHAHQNGVIHRDLKPGNVIISQRDENELLVKIIDFGIAQIEDQETTSTDTGIIKGSPYYLSPEIIRGEQADLSADIYSFGCMIYKTLTGSVPFKGANVFETFQKHASEPVPFVRDSLEDCPKALNDLIYQCMQKAPSDRPQSGEELVQRLESILEELKQTPQKEEAAENVDSLEKLKPVDSLKKKFNTTPWALLLVMFILTFVSASTIMPLFIDSKEPEKNSKEPDTITVIPDYHDKAVDATQPLRVALSKDGNYLEKVDVYITDKEVAQFIRTKPAGNLDLSDTRLTGSGLSELYRWRIKWIDMGTTKLNDEGMKNICRVKTLERLDVKYSDITDKGLSLVKNLPKLWRLNLESTRIDGSGFSGLKENSKLRELIASHTKINDQSLKLVSRLKNLEVLEIGGTQITDNGVLYLKDLKNLKHIELSYCSNVSQQAVIELLKSCKKINEIKLKAIKLNSKIIPHLVSHKPRTLLLADTELKNEDMKKLAAIKGLEEVDISFNSISRETFEAFAKNPSMKKIYLKQPHPGVSDDLIEHYRDNKKLDIRERDKKLPLPITKIKPEEDLQRLLLGK